MNGIGSTVMSTAIGLAMLYGGFKRGQRIARHCPKAK